MKKQNLLVLVVAVVLVAAVAVVAAVVPKNRTISTDAPAVSVIETTAATEQPEATEEPASTQTPEATQQPEMTADTVSNDTPAATEMPPVEAYLVMSVRGNIYEPLPLAGEGSFTIKQDENTTNTVHVTPNSVWMEHSTCDNQDCVDQGTVSLENMHDRVLYNMIICLPNEVVLELHTPETLAETFGLTQE